jgi:flagellar hook-length control protein FliK
MTVGRAPIADLIYETQILVEARYQRELFKSLSASGEINSKGQMGSSQLETPGSNLKNNNSLELISYGKHLSLTKYLDFSTFEASLTVLPKFNFTEQNLYASPGHLSRTLIDGKNDKSIASVVELFVGKGTEITTSDNKSTSSSTKGKVIRVDVLKKTWEHQVVSKLVSGIKDNASSIDLILHPKKLGEVSVQIFSDENNVNIKLTSESQSVANLFKTTENQLETLLSQNGMKLAGFTVGYDSQGRDSNRNSPQSNNSKNSILSKKKSEKLVQKDLKTESIAMNRHVGDYDYLV